MSETLSPAGAPAGREGLNPDAPVIEIRGLAKHFQVSRHENLVAVGGVNLTIAEGETVGLVGESGSGKTTLGRVILRLTEPTAGEIYYRGVRMDNISEGAFRRYRPKLQMVFQDPASSLNPRMTIQQTLNDAMSVLHLSREQKIDRTREVLDAVHVSLGLLGAHPEALTASQQQRCAIARSLVMQPDLIVLDEAVSMLDVRGRLEILDLLKELQIRFQMSYLFISHDLTAVRSVSHRVAVMYLGNLVETAQTGDLFLNPTHPYTRSLLSAVLYPDPEAAAPLYKLEGEIPQPHQPPAGLPPLFPLSHCGSGMYSLAAGTAAHAGDPQRGAADRGLPTASRIVGRVGKTLGVARARAPRVPPKARALFQGGGSLQLDHGAVGE